MLKIKSQFIIDESVALIFYKTPVYLLRLKKFKKFELVQPELTRPANPD